MPNAVVSRARRLAALLRDRSGVAALEFGLVLPVLFIVLAATIDIAGAVVAQSQLTAGVSAAANFALLNAANVTSTNGATLASNVASIVSNSNGTAWANSSVVVNDGPSTTITSGTASSSGTAANADSCYCPTGTGTGTVTWGSPVSCGGGCADGSLAGRFVAISGTYKFTPFFSGYTFLANSTLSSYAVVQVAVQ